MRLLRGPPPKKLMCIILNSSVLSIDLYSDRNLMLKECAKRKYAYVYPLSGHGFPIKSWDYIHRFFNEHSGEQFLYLSDTVLARAVARNCIRYYWFLQEGMGEQNQ